MFDAATLNRIEELSRQAAEPKVIDSLTYLPAGFKRVEAPEPAPLEVKTLTAVVDYIRSDADLDRAGGPVFLHVIDHSTVAIRSMLYKFDAVRETFLIAKCQPPAFPFGRFLETEEFIIGVQAMFEDVSDRATILSLMGNIKEENVQNTGDDGISQKVTAKAGVSLVTNVKVPNPVVLAPFRTFSEIEQPRSPFVFRLQSGPKAALIEADGGAWKNDAIIAISEFLKANLEDFTTRPVHILA